MPKRGPENVLLLVPEERRARLAAALAPVAAQVWKSPAELPPNTLLEVVVIDGATDRTPAGASQVSGGVGIVAIGHDPADRAEQVGPAADVVLAPDFTDRELRITCRLVARLARLRGELAAGARREAAVWQIADSDPLTGLANRRAWDRYLENLDHDSAASERWLAVVDLDRFKQVNDAGGMARGDEILRRTAQALARQLRRHDVIARLGGDEFGIVLCHVNRADAGNVFERLRSAVSTECEQAGAAGVTASIGYVSIEAVSIAAVSIEAVPIETANNPDTAEGVLLAAEQAMRLAKRQGGNRVVFGPACARQGN